MNTYNCYQVLPAKSDRAKAKQCCWAGCDSRVSYYIRTIEQQNSPEELIRLFCRIHARETSVIETGVFPELREEK